MIPSEGVMGFKLNVYTKVMWGTGMMLGWGSMFLFIFNLIGLGWASFILGLFFMGLFVYCARVDHARWCPIHGTEKEEDSSPSSEV